MSDDGKSNPGRRAIVIGGSMAGLFAAHLLLAQGWDVAIYERISAELAGRGAGIVTHDELFEVLRLCGIDSETARIGVAVKGRRVFAADGTLAGEHPLPQVLTSWGRLYSLLREALPEGRYHYGRNLERLVLDGEGVTVHFSAGEPLRAELLVGADGIFSTVRKQVLPEVMPSYVGYIAWRGLVDEVDLSRETRAALFDSFAFSLPPGEQMLGYPVAGADESMEPGRRRFNFVWYRPAPDAVLRDLLTDVDGMQHELSIPPNKIRPRVQQEMRRAARQLLSPQFAEVVERTPHPFIQAIQDLETPHMAIGGRVALIGDAAFVARPHVGMGVTKAASDALALVQALARSDGDIAAGLAAFEAERLPYGRAVIRRARHLGAYMQAQLLTEEERRLAERHRRPEAVMCETAVATGIAA
ncbi:FAD binding domain-containing protein [Chelatococcus asaccharovorans]|uniref:2-polyprenyl-6-methoxyphenol hydroxylase-like FAD-dependent oxidoreductase n=1 Tax=Chelatococcus asaccharovorans TaxID=28210 RepID=A0A2V3UHS1_9HYPH|nr:FAD binding domain-containing protein [Chelatococcus asaccharovorans]MBS7706634.1 FAD binding domain-containing protein [Chelatococcus asaccharovorans]PXW64716.1 2-polyprenyl-6-methoxyphenol hydroxylase-like FAD-dependent oxidoreductase [Chelatococcus asaccharovorans]